MASLTRRCAESLKREQAETCCRLWEVFLAFSNGMLTLVAFGTPYWVEYRGSSKHEGLWQQCDSVASKAGCTAIPFNTSAYLMATRFFMCLAMAPGLLSWVITIVALLQYRARWLLASAICYSVQAFLMMIALGSFGRAFTEGDEGYSSWSYTVGWVAFLLAVLSAIYFVLVAVFRLKCSGSVGKLGAEDQPYTPLAQFEESTGSDDDSDDNL